MKALLINGSPHEKGCVAAALDEVGKALAENGVSAEFVQVGHLPVRGCVGCQKCMKTGKCVFDDIVNEIAPRFEACDALVVGSPVYYASPNGTLLSFLDRLFYSTRFDKTMKAGAAIVSARRGGCTASFDVLNKYFTISGMPVVSSQYWNMVHGNHPAETAQDAEGLQTMRTLGNNIAFLVKSIALGKEKFGLPKKEVPPARTDFIR